jgi:hypothetical protein
LQAERFVKQQLSRHAARYLRLDRRSTSAVTLVDSVRISPAFVVSEFLESSGGLAICTARFLGANLAPSKQTN